MPADQNTYLSHYAHLGQLGQGVYVQLECKRKTRQEDRKAPLCRQVEWELVCSLSPKHPEKPSEFSPPNIQEAIGIIRRCGVGIPPHNSGIRALHTAELAGLKVDRLVAEPTAAALQCAFETGPGHHFGTTVGGGHGYIYIHIYSLGHIFVVFAIVFGFDVFGCFIQNSLTGPGIYFANTAHVCRAHKIAPPLDRIVSRTGRTLTGQTVAVFDLGGGTFDVSVLRCASFVVWLCFYQKSKTISIGNFTILMFKIYYVQFFCRFLYLPVQITGLAKERPGTSSRC